MSTTEVFLVAMAIIFGLPYAIWRLGRTDHFAPLVVVQILTGIALGPGALGWAWPEVYGLVFSPVIIQTLNGLAWWSVMLFVFIAGVELDLKQAWSHRRESGITAGLALGVPMVLGACAAWPLWLAGTWSGPLGHMWSFVLGIGMACAVTALPILMLFMDRLGLLRQSLGQRILRYASLDDIAIWAVLALILMDWTRVGKQVAYLAAMGALTPMLRHAMRRLPSRDRWHVALLTLLLSALGADWCGLHFMVGAFLAGAVMDSEWFDQTAMDNLRHHVLLIGMPVFFLSTGLKTQWGDAGWWVLGVAAMLLVASVAGKLAGVHLAGRLLGWPKVETRLIGWLLQTKALIMIIFANVLLDKGVIAAPTFTALLFMAVGSTMLTIPMVTPLVRQLKAAHTA